MDAAFSKFSNALNRLGHFSPDQVNAIFSRLRMQSVSRGEFILRPGKVCSGLWWVEKGSLIHYHTHEEEELVINLWMEGDWLLDHQSFTRQEPSRYFIRTHENCVLYYLSIDDLHELIALSGVYFQLGRVLEVDQDPQWKTNRSTPEQRYIFLMKVRPQVFNAFPLKMIASYLGMAPETLSRVRRTVMEKSKSS